MAYQSHFIPHFKLKRKKNNTFSELIRTYTIRDYSFYPRAKSAYGEAPPGWPSSDNIHMQHSTHLAVHRNDALQQMHAHPLKCAIRWDTISPLEVISAALTNEQKMSVCVASHLPCTHRSASRVPACIWERLQRRPFSPLLLSYVCVWTQHSVFRIAWDRWEQGRSLGKCKWVEWISRSKCRLCIKLHKGQRSSSRRYVCGALRFGGDWESSLCCVRGTQNGQ